MTPNIESSSPQEEIRDLLKQIEAKDAAPYDIHL